MCTDRVARRFAVTLTLLAACASPPAPIDEQAATETPAADLTVTEAAPSGEPPSNATAMDCVRLDNSTALVCRPPEGILRITSQGVLDWGQAQGLRVTGMDGGGLSVESVAVPAEPELSDDAIPDARLVDNGDGLFAYVAEPTDRYDHAILGDPIEGTAIAFLDDTGEEVARFSAPGDTVIEDLAPRFADMDGDGRDELVTIITAPDAGAALAIVAVDATAGTAELLAQRPPIGLPGRWLNPLPPIDIDEDGDDEVAYVQTPHAGGIVRVQDLVDGELVEVGQIPGYTNHAIRTTEQDLALSLTGPDGAVGFLLPRDGRGSLVLLDATNLGIVADVDLPGLVSTAMVAVDGGVVVGLDTGEVVGIPLPLPGTTLATPVTGRGELRR